jgi:PTS system ascorbate-specific IIA component
MIDMVRRVGPYMVLAPGLALPHARPEDGVLAAGVSLITLAKPVEFGSQENDPVSLVIAFGNPDKTSHINLLSQLAGLLGEESRRQKLSAAKSVKEVIEIIQQFETANS